tara:strand:+ start:60 stop:227 length:168 start_codon:yes stop_codon:yes gene_type:complete
MNETERKQFNKWLSECPIDWKFITENEATGLITYIFYYLPYVQKNKRNISEGADF